MGLMAPVLFTGAMHLLNQPWNHMLTWTGLRSLINVSCYDLLRMAWSEKWLAKTWVHEHIFQIVGAFYALTATLPRRSFRAFSLGRG